MNSYLMSQYEELALALHANYRDRFAWHNGRWWMATQIEGEWIWTQHWARETALEVLADFVTGIQPTNINRYMLSTLGPTNNGAKHVMAAAARIFKRRGLPAPVPVSQIPAVPAPEPAAPAPADPSTPEQLDQ